MSTGNESFMRAAIKEALVSKGEGGRAFGSVLAKDVEVVARAHNRAVQDGDPTSHAELNVIRQFFAANDVTDLSGYTLYATCEPCPMCAAAIAWANISAVVFGADRMDGPSDYPRQVDLSCEEVLQRSGQQFSVEPYLLRSECAALFN